MNAKRRKHRTKGDALLSVRFFFCERFLPQSHSKYMQTLIASFAKTPPNRRIYWLSAGFFTKDRNVHTRFQKKPIGT